MIEKWVHWIVQVLLQENIIAEQEKEVYVYCFQTMLFQSIVYGTIIILAIGSGSFIKNSGLLFRFFANTVYRWWNAHKFS